MVGGENMSVAGKRITIGDRIFDTIIIIILCIAGMVILYPLLLVVSGSFSSPFALMSGQVVLFPVEPTLKLYKIVFSHPEIMRAYANTILYTGLGTLISVSLTSFAAYPLSRRDFYGRGFFTTVLMITMFFNGGMIPSFLLVKNLGLLNTIWAIVLPGAVSVYNTIVMRTFYQSNVPLELQEAAELDGANDIQFFFKIVIPISKAILAVMVLFYGVSHWNSWYHAFIYMSSRSKYPLQLILREIIIQGSTNIGGATTGDTEMIGEGIKYATMVVATVPIMCLYPFLQKYFVQGVMIGSLKG